MVIPTQQKLEHGSAVLTTGPWQHVFPVLLAVTKIIHTTSLGKILSIKKIIFLYKKIICFKICPQICFQGNIELRK